ncbi:MAG TPA: nuclear transport factor 2 family protein [Actinomycetes bacterium]|nr:nuclear transport factor 2 family protein [Actinomycetes bacterium]
MQRDRYDEYVRRFNAEDPTAFDDFLTDDMRMQNGTLVYHGVQGMKDHYARIWGTLKETLHVERFVSDEHTAAVQLWANFEALVDAEESLFGPLRKGDQLDYRGIIMYRLRDGKFCDIRVAYNSFTFTGSDGVPVERGIPH